MKNKNDRREKKGKLVKITSYKRGVKKSKYLSNRIG